MENEKRYKVYMLIFPNDKKYIGITSRTLKERFNYGYGYFRSNCGKAIQEFGWKKIIAKEIFSDLSKEEAENKEKELISLYKTNNLQYGYNIENGGINGHDVPISTRQKISDANKGENNGMYGKSAWNKGIPMKEETKEKLRIINKNKTKNGNFNKNAIAKMIEVNKKRFANGYHFEGKAKENIVNQAKINLKNAHKKNKKIINQYDLNGIFIKQYESLTQACNETKCDFRNVSACCKGKIKSAYGFIWKYESDVKENEL